jgi:predicted dehydrogenase
VKTIVIGVGHLGRHHARILSSMPGVALAGVVDLNGERAADVAAEYHTMAYRDWRDVPGGIDAAIIAVPTDAHAAAAEPILEAGVAALVEKPLTRTVSEADRLLAAAARGNAVLAVGHSERFNPAVVAARPHLHDPRFIEVHRLGTSPERSLDIDVVLDLMIHDLDLILDVVPSEVAAVEAVGVPVLTPRVDIANARIRFANGCIANLTASRISREPTRKVRFFQRDAYVSIDTAEQKAELWRLVRPPGAAPRIDGGRLEVSRDEPLKNELEDFLGAVRDRRPPAVGGAQGRAALELASRIVESMHLGNSSERRS